MSFGPKPLRFFICFGDSSQNHFKWIKNERKKNNNKQKEESMREGGGWECLEILVGRPPGLSFTIFLSFARIDNKNWGKVENRKIIKAGRQFFF